MTVIFIFCLENSHKALDFSIVVSFLYLLPAILLVQEVVTSIQSDLKDGIIENWLGSGANTLSYIACKIAVFSFFLATPFVILVGVALLLDYAIRDVLYVTLSLLSLSITFISFGCLMGLSHKPKAYLGILLLPLVIPSFLSLIAGIETGEYTFPLILSFGMMLISISLSIILSNLTTRNLF
jgi:hypothetical protein